MKLARRIGIAIAGGTVLLIGIVMIFLPGPSIIVIPMGLAILALEFSWAKRLLVRVKRIISRLKRKLRPPKTHKP
jgi:tellurite resistance protein TerC